MLNVVRHCLMIMLISLGLSVSCFAADGTATSTPAAASLPDVPSTESDRTTAVAVEYEGTDSIGARLALRLKEHFNTASLFTLTEKNVPKIRVLLSTKPEFPSRPGVGSAYAVVWVFSQSEGTLRHYLAREIGLVTADDVDALALKIVERTDGLGVKYGYLF